MASWSKRQRSFWEIVVRSGTVWCCSECDEDLDVDIAEGTSSIRYQKTTHPSHRYKYQSFFPIYNTPYNYRPSSRSIHRLGEGRLLSSCKCANRFTDFHFHHTKTKQTIDTMWNFEYHVELWILSFIIIIAFIKIWMPYYILMI